MKRVPALLARPAPGRDRAPMLCDPPERMSAIAVGSG